ncbi:MAG: hypothetical protein V5A30_00970 [Haloarculaceae archaeon]
MMRPRSLLGLLGAALAGAGAVAVFLPGSLLSVGPVRRAVEAVGGVEPTAAVLLASGVTGLYLAVVARSGGETVATGDPADRRFATAAEAPPEAVTADRRRLAGADLDAAVDRASASGGPALREVRGTLARTATDIYAEYAGVDRDRAREAVRAGTWTRDPVAAAFLAGEGGPDSGLAARARLWLVPERERARRVERTVRAIEHLGGRE